MVAPWPQSWGDRIGIYFWPPLQGMTCGRSHSARQLTISTGLWMANWQLIKVTLFRDWILRLVIRLCSCQKKEQLLPCRQFAPMDGLSGQTEIGRAHV